jgi:hypothetical protein
MIGKLIGLPFAVVGKLVSLVFFFVKLGGGVVFGVVRHLLSHLLGGIAGALIGFVLGRKHVGIRFGRAKKRVRQS